MALTKNWSGARIKNPNSNSSSAKIANTSSNAVRGTGAKLSGN